MPDFDDFMRRMQPHLQKGEDFSVKVFHRTRDILPLIGRLLLLSSYLEEAYRIVFYYEHSMELTEKGYKFSTGFSHFYWMVTLILELCGSGLILSRKNVAIGCGMLMVILTAQVSMLIFYYFHLRSFIRLLSQYGALLLCWAEWHATAEKKMSSNAFSTMLPSLESGSHKPLTMLQLSGRLLIALMFFNVLELDYDDLTVMAFTMNVLAVTLAGCIAVGYRTKLAALTLIVGLFIFDVTHYAFWALRPDTVHYIYEGVKRSFFLVLNVIGGFMLIASIGAGSASIDQRLKKGL